MEQSMEAEKIYSFFAEAKIISGLKALENIPFELESSGASRPLVFVPVTPGGKRMKRVLSSAFKSSGLAGYSFCTGIDEIPPEYDSVVVSSDLSGKINKHTFPDVPVITAVSGDTEKWDFSVTTDIVIIDRRLLTGIKKTEFMDKAESIKEKCGEIIRRTDNPFTLPYAEAALLLAEESARDMDPLKLANAAVYADTAALQTGEER